VSRLHDIGEDALIRRLVELVPRDPAVAAGPGDDCAVVDEGGGELRLLKTDALVEGVHYMAQAEPRRVGWKAVARVVSDFAAMGGVPERFLVTLALPPELEVGWVEEFYRGMGGCLERFGSVLAGGETAAVPRGSAAVISIAATGRVERGHLVLRSTGREGDELWVTGVLGGSLAGRHLDFMPRVAEAGWLVRNFKPSAMMDLSDGLAKDLPRMAEASRCGYVIERESLPLADGCVIAQALGDGEDFELLFALEPGRSEALQAAWREAFPEVLLSRIGCLLPQGVGEPLVGGWEHFA
jgi:thiamine-monophosphate kinase